MSLDTPPDKKKKLAKHDWILIGIGVVSLIVMILIYERSRSSSGTTTATVTPTSAATQEYGTIESQLATLAAQVQAADYAAVGHYASTGSGPTGEALVTTGAPTVQAKTGPPVPTSVHTSTAGKTITTKDINPGGKVILITPPAKNINPGGKAILITPPAKNINPGGPEIHITTATTAPSTTLGSGVDTKSVAPSATGLSGEETTALLQGLG